ncbi:MAG: ATP-dependent zinc metalloprotease FtsH [Patescibacteria group bacterium]|nr:ATP-dependent zinc metalloprotease FtsH [Patescibacteria group bacterium]
MKSKMNNSAQSKKPLDQQEDKKDQQENKKDKSKVDQKPKKSAKKQSSKKNKIKKFEVKIDLNQLFNKGIIYIIVGILFLPFLISLFTGNVEQISLSQMVTDIGEEKVEKIQVAGSEIKIDYKDESQKVALKETNQEALSILNSAGIDLTQIDLKVEDISLGQMAWELVLNLLPLLLMFVLFAMIFKKAKGGQSGLLGFGQSKAKIFVKGKQDIKFDDVGGMDEAKKELEEVVDFLKQPKKYTKVGARTPKGVLLVGPSGTGKTLLARAVAGEANVQFLSIAGSEFMEMLVGVGASRARDLFETAKKMAPAIIFIDEIDAIGRTRGRGDMGGHNEREQTLNQILVEMDGFEPNDNVIVIAATNRGDMLDPALIRPGRFDRRVLVSLPDLKERQEIIKIHSEGKPISKDFSMENIAKSTVGFSGADIENMLNEAAIAIARDEKKEINEEYVEEASLKVKLGPSKKRLRDEYERKITAYHEAGHAILAHVLPFADPVHRISIISRGRALGFTFTPPERDKLQTTKSELLDRIVEMLGGRTAEMLVFNEQTTGASSDIQKATKIARSMVVEYGMSELGPMNFGPQYNKDDHGQVWSKPFEISGPLQEKVDDKIQKLISQGQKKSIKLIKKYRQQLDGVAKKLLKVETLDGDEFEKIIGFAKVRHSQDK